MTARKRLLVPALSTAVMVAILLTLGAWQVQRREWKRGLLDAMAAAEHNPPVPLATGLPPFSKVSVTGHLRADLAAGYGAEVRGNALGTQLLVPLERAGAPALLADLGWVADPARAVLPPGEVTLTGYIRPGEHPGWFAATDNIARRAFYTFDPPAIGAALGVAVEPYALVVLGDSAPPGAPDPARHLPDVANNHLQYAITWFSLAAVLLAVFTLYLGRPRP